MQCMRCLIVPNKTAGNQLPKHLVISICCTHAIQCSYLGCWFQWQLGSGVLELTLLGEVEGRNKYKKLTVEQMNNSSHYTASLKLPLRHKNTSCWVLVAGLLLPFRQELLTAFCWLVLLGPHKCLVNFDLQVENQVMIHMGVYKPIITLPLFMLLLICLYSLYQQPFGTHWYLLFMSCKSPLTGHIYTENILLVHGMSVNDLVAALLKLGQLLLGFFVTLKKCV